VLDNAPTTGESVGSSNNRARKIPEKELRIADRAGFYVAHRTDGPEMIAV
jgi:hypothetical protein